MYFSTHKGYHTTTTTTFTLPTVLALSCHPLQPTIEIHARNINFTFCNERSNPSYFLKNAGFIIHFLSHHATHNTC